MDIDLLSKIVKELILDNDEVALPGIGVFVAEIVPSSFSDKGYTINPPYRRLAFRQKANGGETLLIDFYARCNGLDSATASRIIREFMEEIRHALETKKSVVFPGLGKLRATRENHFFFVADEDLDIYPEGFGLEPISLKTHEETPAEVSATMAALRSILNPEEKEAPEQSSSTEAVKETEADIDGHRGGVLAADNELMADENEVVVKETVADGTGTDEPAVSEPADEGASEDNVADIAGDEADEIPEVAVEETEVRKTYGAADDAESHEPETAVVESQEDAGRTVSEDAENPETADVSEVGRQPVSETAGKSAQPISEENADVKPEEGAERIDSPAVSTDVPADVESGNHDEQDIRKSAACNVMADTVTANSGKRRAWRIVKWTLLTLVLLAVMALVVFVILAHIAPDFIDSILYTPEELELLNL